MNKIYQIIWNKSRQCLMVVGENALSTTKSSGTSIVDPYSPFARWRRAVLAIMALIGAGSPPFAIAQTVITPDGRTQTTVGNVGNVYQVSTATQTGSNAFNSFSAFSVGAGNTVNLYVPSSAINLINIVRDQRTDIYGVLNAIKDGRIGGNVWFANPNGLVVGATGVVNVGSLTVTTPTRQFVDGFFSSPGTPNPASVTQLLAGTAPRDAGAAISVQGRINAVEGVNLSAGAINVAGTIFSGARFIGSAPDFTDVVNTNGLVSANNVVVHEGRIEIVADGEVAISGTLAAPGSTGVRGGDIAVIAGDNFSLDNGALVSVHGNGQNSAGGTVNIRADSDAITRTGALIDASAGSSGDGGAIEFSAKKTVELAGGEFRADGWGGGQGGSVVIDPWNIVVSADILRGAGGYAGLIDGASVSGMNLTLLADNEITVNKNITISTRSVAGTTAADHDTGASTANSGSLTLQAGSISLKSGSKLLAGADSGYAGGDVLLKATRNWTGEAKVSVDSATITGRNVALTANATYNDSILTSWLPVVVPVTVATVDVNTGTIKASGTLDLGATSLIDVNSTGQSPIGVITAVSAATVDVHGSSVLIAGGDSKLAATSTVTSKATPDSPNPTTLSGDAGVAVNVVVSTAKAHVGDSSSVTVSGGKLDLNAKNAVTATTKADATAGGAAALGGTLALSEVTSVTQAVIDGSATTSSTALSVGAESTSTVTTSAKAANKGAKKQTAAEKSAAPSKTEESLAKYKDQTTTADGSVDVAAAVAITNVNNITLADLASTGTQTATGAATVSSKASTSSFVTADGSSASGAVGVGAAVGVNVGVLVNRARVADNASISSNGLTVSAVMPIDDGKNKFETSVTSGAGASNVGVAGALATNVLVNTNVASIEGNTDGNGSVATVNANGGDVFVESKNDSESKVTATASVKPASATEPAAVGVGASVGMNVAANTTSAEIGNGTVVNNANDLDLEAKAIHTLSTTATGGASGADVSVTPVAAITVAANITTSRLGTGGLLDLDGAFSSSADQTSTTTSTATGQTQGNNVAVGASIALNSATDSVLAEIDRDVTATGDVKADAKSVAKSSAAATASVSGGEKAAASGEPPAKSDGSAGMSVDEKVTAQGDAAKAVGKKTADKSAAAGSPTDAGLAAAASAAASSSDPDAATAQKSVDAAKTNSPAAAGAAVVGASNDSKTKVDQTKDAPKSEDNTEAGGVAVAAAVGVNVGIATTTASVAKGRTITSSTGALKVTGTNETDASAKADGSQVDPGKTDVGVGVGAAVALNVGISTNTAVVAENALINTKGLTIRAVNASGEKSDFAAEAKSGAGASNVGVAGSLAANVVVNTTVASLEGDSASDGDTKGAVVNAGNGDILIEAANATTSSVKSDADVKGTDAAAKVGVGASIGMNVAVNTVVAEAGDKSEITNGKDLGLNAKSDQTLITEGTGGAAGAKVAVTPLAAVTLAVNTTTARLGESPVETTLSGKFSSTAEHSGSATTTATGQTAGSSVAVGASLGLTSAVDTVSADLERDISAANGVEVNAKSTAKSSTSATASVSGGEKAKDDGTSSSGQSVDDKIAGQNDKANAAGKASAAKAPATTPAAGSSASDKLDTNKQTAPKGETSEGGVSVAAAVGVNVGVATTTAKVGKGRKVTSSAGALKVTSVNQTDSSAKADGSQVDSAKSTNVGVGAAVALNVGVATTTAIVSDEANVSTKGLTISAMGVTDEKSDSAAEAKSGAGAANVGVAGSLAINVATNTTLTQLEGDSDSDASVAQVNANGGAVLIEAQNATTSSAKVSADVKGTDDKAKVGVGAAIGVNVAVNTTVAEVADHTRLANAGSLGLNATANHALTTDVTGGAAGAKVSITPVVAATIAVNTTSAHLGDSTTTLGIAGAYSSSAEQTNVITTKATGQAQGDVAVGASLGATIAVDNVSATVGRNVDAASGLELAAKSDTSLTTEVKAGAKGAKAAKKDSAGNETAEAGTTVDEQKKNQLDFAKGRNAKAAVVSTDTPEAKTPDTTEQAPSTDKPTGAPTNEKQGKKVSVAAAIGATVAYNQATAEIAANRTVGAGTGKLKVASTTDTNYRTLATGEAVSDDVGVAAAVALTATYNKTQAEIGSGVTVSDAGDVDVSATARQNRAADFQKQQSAEAVSGASGGDVAVAGALAAVGNWNETRALIDEGVTMGSSGAPVGDVTVATDETSKIAAQARAGALSKGANSKAGVGASFAVLLSYNQNTAAVGYDANANGISPASTLFADSLTVTSTKNRVRFLSPTWDDAKNFTSDNIKSLDFTALDPATYLGSNNYYTEAVAGAASKGKAAVAGAFAVNVFGNTTEAYLGNAVNVTTSGKQPSGEQPSGEQPVGEQLGVDVAARSDTQAVSFVGGVAGAKQAGVGIAATSVVNLDKTLASIGEDAVVKSNADGAGVKLSAYARQDITNIGIAGGLATDGVGVGGVLGAIVSLGETEAKIAEDATVKSMGDVDVEATSDIDAVLVSGGVAGGKNAGVGAAIAGNVLANDTHAEVGAGAQVTAKNNLTVAADANETAITAVVAGAGGEKLGVAGALSLNVIVGDTIAVVGQGAQLNTDNADSGDARNVAITAHDDTLVLGIAGGGAGGGKAGIGAALDTTVLVKTVKATVEDDTIDDGKVATINADRNVQIDATSSELTTSVSMGFAGGGNVGVGGAVSVAVNKNDVQAGIGKSAKVDSDGNVLVNAQDDVTAVLTAGAGAGGGDAGVGGSLAVATLLETTKAYIGDGATVNARGNADAATVITGETVFNDTDSTPTALGAKKTENAKGVSVTAYNREDLITTVVGGAGGGTAGVAATVSVNVMASTTEASIGHGANVNSNNAGAGADQRVRVKAVDETLLIDTAGAGAGGGTAGVGASANVAVIAKTTTAKIGKQATVKATKAIELDAASSDIVVTTAIGLAGGGSAGVGGAVAGSGVANVTQAFVEDGALAAEAARLTVSAGDLTLNAKEFSSSWLVATGGAGGGAAGVGGSLAAGVNASTTKARIGDYAETDASDMTTVHADSVENVNTVTIAGAGGGSAGVAGAISTSVIVATTEAGVGKHAQVNQPLAGQSVDVAATDKIVSVSAGGSGAGGGAAGVGVTANVTVALNTTSAYIDNDAVVSVTEDVKVSAASEKHVDSVTFSGAGGGAAGVAGAVSVIAVGSLLEGDAKSGLSWKDNNKNMSTMQSESDGQLDKSVVGSLLGNSRQSQETTGQLSEYTESHKDKNGNAVASKLAIGRYTADTTPIPLKNTRAFIGDGATVKAGRDVAVTAKDNTVAINANGAGAGGGAAGVAGSLGVTLLHDSAEAFVANQKRGDAGLEHQAKVDAGLKLSVKAETSETVVNVGVTGYGGGVAGVGGSAAVNVVTSNTSAYIGSARINQENSSTDRSVEVEANSSSNMIAVAGSGGGAEVATVGGVLNVNTLAKKTTAFIGEGAMVEADKNVIVDASSAQNIISAGISIQGAGAGAVGGAATVNVVANTTEAFIGSERDVGTKTAATVDSDGNVVVAAADDTLIIAVAGSGTGAGAAAVGGAAGANVISSQTRAYVGKNAVVDARGKALGATVANGLTNDAVASSGPSLPSGVSGSIDADRDGVNDGNVGSSASFYLPGAGSSRTAANPSATKDSQGNTIGNAAGGLGAKGTETATGLSVIATGNEKIVSTVVGVAGAGALGVTGALMADVIISKTDASIADGAQINQKGGVIGNRDVRVRASDNTFVVMASGTVAGGGGAGVSGSANVADIAKETSATIGEAKVRAGDVIVQAAASDDLYVVDANVSFGAAGVGGAVGVAVVKNSTKAGISKEAEEAGVSKGATIDADGGIAVKADQDTSVDIYTVSGAGGGGAFSGALSVGVVDNTTRAYVKGAADDATAATLDAGGAINVAANSREAITTGTVSASAGGVGVAGAVGVKVVTSETTATIGDYTKVNQTRRGGTTQDVSVSATDSVELKGGSGALAMTALVGVGATADINIVRNTTTAGIGNRAKVSADSDIGVLASSAKDVDAVTTAVAIPAGYGPDVSVAGAVALAFVGSSIESESDAKSGIGNGKTGSAVDKAMKDGAIDKQLKGSDHVAGAKEEVASRRNDLGVSADLAKTDADTADKTVARIGGNATIVAGNKVGVTATDSTQIDLDVVGAAGGTVGLGAAIGVGLTRSTIEATVGASTTIDADGDVSVTATSANVQPVGSKVTTTSGAGSVIGANASVALLKDKSATTAALADSVDILDAATLTVAATTSRQAHVEARGLSIGLAAVGASVAIADFDGTTTAQFGKSVHVAADDVEISASDSSVAGANSIAGTGGIVAGSGSVATASVTSTVTAKTDTAADIEASKDVDITATSTARTEADAIGVNVGAGAVGASVAMANSGAKVYAELGGSSKVSGKSFDLIAKRAKNDGALTARAYALGAAGGLLLGANATEATAKSSGETKSTVGNGSSIATGIGMAVVKAENDSLQSASGFGFASGVLSVGADFSYASSDSLTQASLGDNVKVTGAALQIVAAGSDSNYSFAKAGAGGLVTVPFSAAYTTNTSRTYAGTGSGDSSHKIDVGSFYMAATHAANFDSWIESTVASLIGVSGALARNTVSAETKALLGASADVEADNIVMQAGNTINKASPGSKIPGTSYETPKWNVNSRSGGLADVPAAESATTIVSDAQVGVGPGSHLEQTGDKASPGNFDLDAWSSVNASDRVQMSSGGAVSAASGKSSIMEDVPGLFPAIVNRVDSAVVVAPGADLSSLGEMALGARSDANVSAQTAVDVYGAVGVAPAGDSIARFKGSNRVEIGAAATLTSDNDIRLSAGENTSGVGSSYAATARSDVFNNTAIPVNRDPVADAIVDTSSLVNTSAGSDVAAARHVSLFADKGSATASGVGVGKDIYREVLAAIASAISEFFGGDPVSFETRTGNSVKSQKNEVKVDGTVRTGTNRQQILEIDKNGVDTVKAGDIHVVSDVDKGVASDLIERIRMLESLIDDYEVSGATGQSTVAVAAYKSEINFLKNKLKAIGFEEDPDKPGFYSAPASGSSPRSLAEERLNAMTTTRSGYVTTSGTLKGENDQYDKDIEANKEIFGENVEAIATKKASIKTNEDLIKTLDPKDDAVQIKNLQDANVALKQQYETLESQNNKINTVTNPGIQASIDANLPKINALDTSIKSLTDAIDDIDLAAYSTTPFSGPTANFKSISDATAQLGNIYVRGDKLTGAGTLEAPGDAQIMITNYSPSYMILHNLSIASNTGGKIYFNGVDVNSSAEINSVNGGSGAGFSVKTAKTQAAAGIEKPTIEIISNFNPLSADYLGSTAPEDRKLAPDIILHGDISNLNGLVRIKSESGSIRLEQKRDENEILLDPVQTAGIRANSVELSTKSGDFVQSYTDSFYHVAGRGPIKLIEADDKLGTMDSLQFESEVAGSGIVANGSVFIAARYLNINGIVQSGMSEWGVSIPAGATVVLDSKSGVSGSFADAIANYAAKSIDDKAKTGAEYYAVSGATVAGLTGNKDGDWQKVDVFFNAKENRLELNGVQVQGGYIELFGQIINTNKSGGELRVLDGYGKIKVENNTNLALVVNMLNTGNNIEGKISITNILGFNPDGSLIVQGDGAQVFKRNGGSRDGGEYSLTDGMRYAMQVGYDTGATEYYRYSRSGWFDIASTFTDLALDNYRLYSDPPKTNPMLRGEYLITGSTIADETKVHPTENIPTFAKLTKGNSWKDCNWWTLCMNATYYQEFALETKAKVIDSNSVAASNPIKIKYIGYDQGEVSVNSIGNIILAGSVANLGGNTAITSTQGAITQTNETVQVSGTNIALSAKTGIGDSTHSLRVNAGDSGRVDAATQSGDIYVREMLGDFRVGNIGGANVTNVVLQSDRNMVNAGAGSWVQGQRVELLSDDGGIGADGSPLAVRSAYTSNTLDWPYYGLKATARDSINLRNEKDVANAAKYSGNLLLISAESLTGDVRIETAGSVIDNNPIAKTDVRSQTELAALWDELRLRNTATDRKADKKADESVAAYKQGKEVNYALYWRMRNSQSDGGAAYNANYQMTAAERSALATSGMTSDEINTFEVNRRSQYQQLHADVGSLTANYQDGYLYTVSSAEDKQIRSGSVWTDAQLQLSIGAGLLKNLTDTVTTIKAPNAKGRNVTLIAGENIGSYNAPVVIDLSNLDALSTEDKAALAAAERGDANMVGKFVTIVQPRPVNVAVGSGALNASAAAGYALIGSEQDLRIERVSAATDISIKTAGGLINGSTVGVTNISGDDLILEAASGGIGGETDADGNVTDSLVIDIDGQLIARAAKDVWIDAEGELKADTVYSRMDMRLDAQGSILDSHVGEQDPNKPLDPLKHAPEINLRARNIVLNSATGSVGEYGNELDVGVNRDGFVSVSVPTFGKGVYLNAPSGEYFNIGTITSGDAVTLRSATDMTIDGAVTGPGPFTMQSLGAMKLTPTADVHATTLGMFLLAGSLEMQDAQFMIGHGQTLDPKYAAGDAARMRVDVGTIDIQTKGDALITGIETDNGTASAIHVVSTAGRILDNGDTRLDMIADTGPAAKLTIEAAKGIGDDQLDMRLLNLDATSGGVVDISVQNGVNVVGIKAGDRVWLTVGDDVTGASVISSGNGGTNPDRSITIASLNGQVDLERVSGTRNVSVSGRTGVTVDRLDVGSNVNLAGRTFNASVFGGLGRVGGSVTGFGGGVADSVNLMLSGAGGFWLSSLSAATANVNVPLGVFSVDSLRIADRATITNPWTIALVDQHNRSIQPANAQLYSSGDPFSFMLDRNLVTTTSFVIHNDPQHEVTTPFGEDWAADRQGDAALARLDRRHDDDEANDMPEDASGTLIAFGGVPVSLEGGEAKE